MELTKKTICFFAVLGVAAAAPAQLNYVKCCTKQRPAVGLFLSCMGYGGPNKPGWVPHNFRGPFPASCQFGFADTIYSINMMARMCWDDAPPMPQGDTVCSSWVDTSKNIAMTCFGKSTSSVCIDIFDFDADLDLDLRDYAFYQNNFGDFRPLD